MTPLPKHDDAFEPHIAADVKVEKDAKPHKWKRSATPGKVGILAAGRFAGKKVVILKRLSDGSLLITGPFSTSGVPLSRCEQTRIICTSVSVDISRVDVSKVEPEYFHKTKTPERKTAEVQMFKEQGYIDTFLPQERIDLQKKIDDSLLPSIKAVPHLEEYMKERFNLASTRLPPHLLKF